MRRVIRYYEMGWTLPDDVTPARASGVADELEWITYVGKRGKRHAKHD